MTRNRRATIKNKMVMTTRETTKQEVTTREASTNYNKKTEGSTK
jgi:hypothetical protein